MKKILSFSLALLVLLLSLTISPVFADSAHTGCVINCGDYTIETTENNECTIIEYKGTDGDVYVPEYIENYKVTAIGNRSFEKNPYIYYVQVPNGVTTIEERAFAFCKKLHYVSIPRSVTTIEKEAFLYCTNMSHLDVPDTVTYIGEKAMGYNTRTLNTETLVYEYKITRMFGVNCAEGTAAYNYYKENGCLRNNYQILNENFIEFVFHVPADWIGFNKIYCQINEVGSDARTFNQWQSKATECEYFGDGVILCSTNSIKGYEEGTVYEIIFSTDTGKQTHPVIFTKACEDDELYTDGTYVVYPSDKTPRLVAKWKNTDQSVYETAFNYWNNATFYTTTPDETTPEETTPDETTYDEALPWGDANCDGDVNIKDATAIQKHIAEIKPLSDQGVILSNYINKNIKLSIQNATGLQKYCAGLTTFEKIGKPAVTRVWVETPHAWERQDIYVLSWSNEDDITTIPVIDNVANIPIYNNNVALTCNDYTTRTWTLDFYTNDNDGNSNYVCEVFHNSDNEVAFIWTLWD